MNIIELAREAGFDLMAENPKLVRFAALVRAAALDEAAGVCEEMFSYGALEVAAAIRQLKDKP